MFEAAKQRVLCGFVSIGRNVTVEVKVTITIIANCRVYRTAGFVLVLYCVGNYSVARAFLSCAKSSFSVSPRCSL
jgi:hypothetical protein